MKNFRVFLALAPLGFAACNMVSKPLASGGDFDPLRSPASMRKQRVEESSTALFKGGDFAAAAMDNTGFYKTEPKGDAKADKLLARGTSMKVVSAGDSFMKVELDGGEIGFVPTVMVTAPAAVGDAASPFAAAGVPLPPVDQNFAAPLPPIGANGLPPDGVIPTVIDPNAPPPNLPLPPVNTPSEGFSAVPAAVSPGSTPAPLPPGLGDAAKPAAAPAPQPVPKIAEKKPEAAPAPSEGSSPAPLPPGN